MAVHDPVKRPAAIATKGSTFVTITHSAEYAQVLAQAHDIAKQTGRGLTSAHLLLAMFTVKNLAELLLLEQRINEETLLARIDKMSPEPPDTLDLLDQRARRIARSCEQPAVNCLHVLAAVTYLPRAFACQLLVRTGTSIQSLRSSAIRYASHGVPHRLFHARAALEGELDPAQDDRETVLLPVLPKQPENDTALGLPAIGRVTRSRQAVAVTEAPRTLIERREELPDETLLDETLLDDRPGSAPSDSQRPDCDSPATAAAPHPALRDAQRLVRRLPSAQTGSRKGGSKVQRGEKAPSPFVLHRETFTCLHTLGRNLSDLAWRGKLDPVIGRAKEIEQAIDVLNKRRANNPCLIGEPGVGKTAVVEGVAQALVDQHGDRRDSPERVIIQLDVGALLAGTHLRGAFAERLRALQTEMRRAAGRVVVFIDEMHTLMGAGGGDGGHDAANELKAALARGEFPCIGATTVDEYRQYVEGDPALDRRFTPVHVEEPDAASTRLILNGIVARYAKHHKVEYDLEAVNAAVRLGQRYMSERRDPDRSLSVLDLAGAVARRRSGIVDRAAVAEVISRIARVPVDHLLMDDPQRFLDMEATLGEQIVGQRHVLEAIGETIRRNYAGFAGQRPIGSFLFLGPTGVGKTEAVKALANFLFGRRDALVRFDMSEFAEAHSISRLVGSPPGYVGHQDGGQLTDALRKRPYQVVLFDEIEKAHRDVWNVLLQVLDEGRLTDSRGRTVDFSNTVVVMTSNLGAESLFGGRRVGFAPKDDNDADARAAKALAKARETFPPELYNRIECRLVFHPLTQPQIATIAHLIATERSSILAEQRGISFELTKAAVSWLIESGGFDESLGARPMRQTIAREVESLIARHILSGELARGAHVIVDQLDDGLDCHWRSA
ncbi:MAG: ATP-dependent Clp protease ATP-binding subunit ClpC [Bradymonadia bacterium]|jgi:ATP-dependent Clp protease ATP-binding subunit ClpC